MDALSLIPLTAGLSAVLIVHAVHHAKGDHSRRAFFTRLTLFAAVYVLAYYGIEAIK